MNHSATAQTSDREVAAGALRAFADTLEENRDCELEGTLILTRVIPVSEDAINRWARNPMYVCPLDRFAGRLTLHFNLEAER